ncbi:MAG: hypothetical protein QF790_05560 [Gammaproteobacteria bacterium]|nr:hypothetical protein [Gammaproteobacteria bacterium]MDP6616614.1 hypothetical protein [Gammaproteobacteria bacterium]MDP6694811.1 hypothetical protein [Gammaproteobacteria bacterium]
MSDATEPQGRSAPAVNQKSSLPAKLAKKSIAAIDAVFPGAEKHLLPMFRSYKLRLRRALWSMRTGQGKVDSARAGKALITVDPRSIEHCSNKEFSYGYFQGAIMDGDWDLSTKRFEDLDVYKAFEAVCKNKTSDWPETSFYQRAIKRINEGGKPWKCATEEEFYKRCESLAELYNTIERDGYQPHSERSADVEANEDRLDEISVAIGRTGELLFSDGAHRLAVAKLLGIKEIPVTVPVRHKEWDKFRGELLELANLQNKGLLYQPCTHPDLVDIPATHSCDDRFDAIRKHLPGSSGALLDIGCNMSYFTHRFEDEGFDCIASENADIHLYFINKFKKANNKKFELRSGSVLEDEVIMSREYEAVLALNIFHHFLKTEKLFIQLTNFLDNLKTRYIFLETHLHEEIQMEEAYKKFTPEELCQFVADHTGLGGYTLIHTADDGRPLYVLK